MVPDVYFEAEKWIHYLGGRNSLSPAMCHPPIRVLIGFCSCSHSHSQSSERVCDTNHRLGGHEKDTSPSWEEQSLVKGSEDRGRCKKKRSQNKDPSRKRTAGALCSWETPVVFLFFVVSEADGFESLVPVFPRSSTAMCPQVEAWTKPRHWRWF